MSKWYIGGDWDDQWDNEYDDFVFEQNVSDQSVDVVYREPVTYEYDDYNVNVSPGTIKLAPAEKLPWSTDKTLTPYALPSPTTPSTPLSDSGKFISFPWETPAGEGFNLNWGSLFGNKETGFGSSLTSAGTQAFLPLFIILSLLKRR